MANFTQRHPVRPLHTEHIHVEEEKTPWLWMLLPLLVLVLLALIFLPSRTQPASVTGTTDQVVTTTPLVFARPITYQNGQWVIKGVPETFPAGEVKSIGRSKQGEALYFNPKKGYMEGEGSQRVPNTISTPSGRVYLRNSDGRYQPLFLQP